MLKNGIVYFTLFLFLLTKTEVAAHSFTADQKVVLITGASRGIGLSTAEHLAAQGYIVYGTVRASSDTTKLDAACKIHCSHLFKVVVSLTDENEIQKAVDLILKEQGRIDVLINNAGYALVGTVESSTVQEQIDLFNINYFGPVRTIQAVLPHMRARKQGMILNISSVSGISPFSPLENYSASKFALRGLSESMSASLSPWNIKVVVIEPATMQTKETALDAVGSKDLGEPDPYRIIRNYLEDSNEGQDPLDLAKLLQAIIETPHPHVRYQIGDFAEEIAKKVYVDPTGDEMVNSNIEYYKSAGLLPRE
ncbi:MAG: SDR family oxidoreductase [Parachlamydia sp.]|nr:SDR family oxidoreductase [Parachlamydia sp.]